MRALARLGMTLWLVASLAATGWTLAQDPFAAPMVARSAASARLALDQAIAATVGPGWIAQHVAAAQAAGDLDRSRMLAGLAADHAILLTPAQAGALAALEARHDGAFDSARDCAPCARDITRCPTLAQISFCALPLELTPVGDTRALGRAGADWAAGNEVEAALAALGLGATAATSAGAAAPARAGATALRLARRMGALPDGLARAVAEAAKAALTGADEGRALTAMAADLGTISRQTSPAEALTLLRHADSARDLTRLARLAEVAGPDTARSLEVLGKARALRLIDRLSNLTLAAIGLVSLVLAQAGTVLLALLRWALSPLWRDPRRKSAGAARRRG